MNRNAELADRLLAESNLQPELADILIEASAIALLDEVIDCRRCEYMRGNQTGAKWCVQPASAGCTNGDKYQPLPIVKLYKVTP